jgi:hypothetical protein
MTDQNKTTETVTGAGLAGVAGSASYDKSLRELHCAVESLMEIVEGVRNERWAVNGRRLKDTPEWCRLYVCRCRCNDILRGEPNNASQQRAD